MHVAPEELRHLCDTIRRDHESLELVTDFLATGQEQGTEIDDPHAREMVQGFIDRSCLLSWT